MIEPGIYSSQARTPVNDVSSWEAPSQDHEISLLDVLTQLAYRKWLIAKVTAIAMLVGITTCLVLPTRYTATTTLMPPQQTQSTASMMMNQLANIGAGSLAAVAGAGLGLKNPNDIYVGLLNSRPLQTRSSTSSAWQKCTARKT